MQGTSAPAGASTFISKAAAQMVQTQRTKHRSLAKDIKKQVPPNPPFPLHKYRQAFSLPIGRLHQHTSQMEPNKIGARCILHFKKIPFIPLRNHPAVANIFH